MPTKLSRSETDALRGLAREAWEAELHEALEDLFEAFCRWADDAYSSHELADRIHEFHNGISRELFRRYTGLPPFVAVARAIAADVLDESALSPALREKLADEIQAQRRVIAAE